MVEVNYDFQTFFDNKNWRGLKQALNEYDSIQIAEILEDLDEFIRTNMLEEQDAESEFIQLKESFLTLMDAKTNIEKAKEQIAQLMPINNFANKLDECFNLN